MKVFTWDKYCELIGVNQADGNGWGRVLKQGHLEIANRLLFTAYSVSKNLNDDRFAVSWNEINALQLPAHISSPYFSSNRNRLQEELSSIGAKLLQQNGQGQYIRTIAFYSGVAFVKVIKNIAEDFQQEKLTLTDYALQYHTPDEIKRELSHYVKKSAQGNLIGFSTEEERQGVLADICDTLVNLMNLYRERLTSFSVEDLLEVCCLPVPRPSAQKIAELFGKVSQERIKIGIGANGEGVFKFPSRAPVLSSDNKKGNIYDGLWIKIVRSIDGNDDATWITYNRENDNWVIDDTYGVPVIDDYVEVPLVDVKEISRIPVLNGEPCLDGAMDIRPRVCDHRYILFVEHADESSIYLPGRKVNVNDVCHVFPTSSIGRLKVTVQDEAGEVQDVSTNGIGKIVLEGNDLETLIIDGDEYPISCSTELDWLDNEKRFRYLYRAGSRAYQADTCPVKVEKIPAATIVVYRIDNNEIILRKKNGSQWQPWSTVPSYFLWQRGTIEIHGDSGILASAKAIFVNVDFGDFDSPSQVDDELDIASIQCQDKNGDWISPAATYKHGDPVVQFEVGGFTIRRPVDRIGVFFVAPNGLSISIQPESEDWREPTLLADRDFEKLSCKVVVPRSDSRNYKVLLIKGAKYTDLKRVAQEKILKNGYTTFHWRCYENALKDTNVSIDCNENRNYFAVCIRSEVEDDQQLWLYKFKIVDPIKLSYNGDGGLPVHSVRHELRDDGTLIARHFISYSDSPAGDDVGPTSLLCCPINKLDDENGFVKLSCESSLYKGEEYNNEKVAQETICVSDFRKKFGEYLSSGCICFLVKEQHFSNVQESEHRLVSSGFCVRDESVPPVESDYSLVSQLREAIATKDEKFICDKFSSENAQDREAVEGLLNRVWKNIANIHAPGIRDYLNIYRCEIKNANGHLVERSGYAFLADWYDFGQNQKTLHGVCRHLFDEYSKYWPRLMFPLQKVQLPMCNQTVDQYLNWYLGEGDAQGFELQCAKLYDRTMEHPLQIDGSIFLKLYEAINARLKFETHPDSDHGGPNSWFCSASIGKCFYSQYYEYRCLNNLQGSISQCWNKEKHEIQRNPRKARAIMEKAPYLYYEGIPLESQMQCTRDILCGLRKKEIRKFLKILASELFEWRKNPNLEEKAQQLKKDLLLLENIDEKLFSAPPNVNSLDANAPCCFTELVELLAYNRFIHSI